MSDKNENGRVEYNQKLITELRKTVDQGFTRVNDKLDSMRADHQEQVNSFYSHCETKRENIKEDIKENNENDKELDDRLDDIERRMYVVLVTGMGLGGVFGYFVNAIMEKYIGG